MARVRSTKAGHGARQRYVAHYQQQAARLEAEISARSPQQAQIAAEVGDAISAWLGHIRENLARATSGAPYNAYGWELGLHGLDLNVYWHIGRDDSLTPAGPSCPTGNRATT